MAGEPIFWIDRWRVLDSLVVGANHNDPMPGDPTGRLNTYSRAVTENLGAVRPVLHTACPDQDDVALLDGDVLAIASPLTIVDGDRLGFRKAFDAMQAGYIEQNAARDDRHNLLASTLLPSATSQVVVGVEAVVDLAAVGKVVERVDVSPGVRIHQDYVTRVAAAQVVLAAHPLLKRMP